MNKIKTIQKLFLGGVIFLIAVFCVSGTTDVFSFFGITKVKVAAQTPGPSYDLVLRDTQRCTRYDRGDYYSVHERCLQKNTLPLISLSDALGLLKEEMIDVTHIYEIDPHLFSYSTTDIIYDDEFQDLMNYWGSQENITQSRDEDGFVMIPTQYIAYLALKNSSVFAAVRDTTEYGECRKTNYEVALREMDGYELKENESLNMNKLIANKPGYCKGGGTFLFYEGACGGSTQLFWNAMLNPFLEVTRRHAHGMWYAGFYGSSVMGDDASMYERGKQLIVKNIGSHPISFGTFVRESDGNTVLLSAYPEKSDYSVMVKKQQTGKKSAILVNTVFDGAGGIVYEQEWESNYRSIDTSTD